ncbi:MAG: hypothetical protein K0S93_1313, partial [Nitrososphaeraceae archaeon]|nr:hypothetical protein [Nitrososphaeraceae archaeon]
KSDYYLDVAINAAIEYVKERWNRVGWRRHS